MQPLKRFRLSSNTGQYPKDKVSFKLLRNEPPLFNSFVNINLKVKIINTLFFSRNCLIKNQQFEHTCRRFRELLKIITNVKNLCKALGYKSIRVKTLSIKLHKLSLQTLAWNYANLSISKHDISIYMKGPCILFRPILPADGIATPQSCFRTTSMLIAKAKRCIFTCRWCKLCTWVALNFQQSTPSTWVESKMSTCSGYYCHTKSKIPDLLHSEAVHCVSRAWKIHRKIWIIFYKQKKTLQPHLKGVQIILKCNYSILLVYDGSDCIIICTYLRSISPKANKRFIALRTKRRVRNR